MQGDHSKLEAERERLLKTAARIVVKLGTSTVTAPDGTLCFERVAPLMQSVARLHDAGKQVVLVSSGAIGLGRGWLGLNRWTGRAERPLSATMTGWPRWL